MPQVGLSDRIGRRIELRLLLSSLLVGGSLLTLAVAAAIPIAAQTTIFQSERGPYRVVTLVGELQDPWSIAFFPNGDMLVTERAGRLRIVRDGVLQSEPLAGVPEVRYGGQGGLLDVALHPEFESNQLIYLSYSKPNADGERGNDRGGARPVGREPTPRG